MGVLGIPSCVMNGADERRSNSQPHDEMKGQARVSRVPRFQGRRAAARTGPIRPRRPESGLRRLSRSETRSESL